MYNFFSQQGGYQWRQAHQGQGGKQGLLGFLVIALDLGFRDGVFGFLVLGLKIGISGLGYGSKVQGLKDVERARCLNSDC